MRKKKSRSGVLRDCDDDFVASAQGGVDAVVELHEENVTVLDAPRKKMEANKNAAVAFAIDTISMNKTCVGLFHKYGNFAAVFLTAADGYVVCPCLCSELGVLCGVADVVTID